MLGLGGYGDHQQQQQTGAHLGDDVVLVLEHEAALAVVLVPVELHHQRLLVQVQLPFFCTNYTHTHTRSEPLGEPNEPYLAVGNWHWGNRHHVNTHKLHPQSAT